MTPVLQPSVRMWADAPQRAGGVGGSWWVEDVWRATHQVTHAGWGRPGRLWLTLDKHCNPSRSRLTLMVMNHITVWALIHYVQNGILSQDLEHQSPLVCNHQQILRQNPGNGASYKTVLFPDTKVIEHRQLRNCQSQDLKESGQ